MKRKIAISCIGIILLTILTGCVRKETTISKEYDLGVVYTSTVNEESNISTYTDLGNYVETAKLNVGGVNLANFSKRTITNKDKVYYTMPVLGNKSQDFIIELNKKDLSYSKIQNCNKRSVTSFDVDDTYAYLGVSSLSETNLSKVKIDNKNVENQISIEGQCIYLLEDSDYIYTFNVINNDTLNYINLFQLNKSDFSVVNTIKIDNSLFITDAIIKYNTIYALINRDGVDALSNIMVKIHLDSQEVENVEIPFNNLNNLYAVDNYLYIIEGSYTNSEITQNRVCRFDINTKDIQTFNTENQHTLTVMKNNKLYSTDGINMYIYDVKNGFNLLSNFELKTDKDMVLSAIF
ncbi:hypothetical protein [uncultured Clostridium sp.]|uniref:hypothetical protein n=1 Tax=uncultured Clostridium sp. TaxID=59620 RepID=UPI0025EAFD61|nr:hypothetical protein [uncultured Clostridium sp.]MDU4884736.1 hypothetical protein [Clostridium celatum]MDU7078227.1 hypothetical protein [Clostridium celatum]